LKRVLEENAVTKSPRPPEPFPWLCPRCGQDQVFPTKIDYQAKMGYEGRLYEFEVSALEVLECRKCGEQLFDLGADAGISTAFRATLGLLQPEQVRAGRKALGLSQKELAAHLGVAEESISRWETGALIQSRVVDRQIRLYFQLPAVRTLLGAGDTPNFGTAVQFSAGDPSPTS